MNPWQTLNSNARRDLIQPLFDYKCFEQGDRTAYNAWYQMYYKGVGARPAEAPHELDHYAEWRFNHRLNHEERNSLLCVYAKMKREDLWKFVKSIDWVGQYGELLFWPTLSQADLQLFLTTHDYSNAWMASRSGKEWGLRSNRDGVELHFRGQKDGEGSVNVHIDLHNPGKTDDVGIALQHKYSDDWMRKKTHTVRDLSNGLIKQGVRTVFQVP
jgi:hypothetical protein